MICRTRWLGPIVWGCLGAALAAPAFAGVEDIEWSSTSLVRHADFNAIDEDGLFTFSGSFPLRLRGVILNNPEEMLDQTAFEPNPIPFSLGASWQVFVQPVEDASDYGGTAVFMGQHYGNVPPNINMSTMPPTPVPDRSYTNAEWEAEIDRVNFDREISTHQFRAGDLVEIRAQERRFFGGKLNVNENHIKEDIADFELHLVTAGYGLPTPTNIELTDIWTGAPVGGHVLLDPSRESGGELYQGSLVRLMNVKLVGNPLDWKANGTVQVADIDGRAFAVKLGLRSEFDSLPAPTGFFHITGVFDQEDLSNLANDVYVAGYRLWVMDPDALEVALPGDYNADGIVDAAADYTVWRNTLGQPGDLRADGNGNGEIDPDDYETWKLQYGATLLGGVAGGVNLAVPEPSSLGLAMIVIASGSLLRRRNSDRIR